MHIFHGRKVHRRERGSSQLGTCVLVRKLSRQQIEVELDYIGFDIPDLWAVGYGLDYADRWRSLPYIGLALLNDLAVFTIGAGVVLGMLLVRYLYLRLAMKSSPFPEIFLLSRGLVTASLS